MDLHKSQATGVIDSDVDVFVAWSQSVAAATAIEAFLLRQQAVTTARWYSAQLLDVDMDQLSRMVTHVVDWQACRPVVVPESAGAMAVEDSIDGRPWHA